MNSFFDSLGERFASAAARRGVSIEAPELDSVVAQELLELARVAAHTQERRFAPLASFMAGVAAERLRAAGGPSSPEALAELLREVRAEVEAGSTATD
ncbi:MAG TPA: DUF6457 domain-containing protein [Candidatus Dormibacteraeota bacterium]|nr:DUF6457 domain-containing protein [Candidatus Dormibacteraeota bacterium]